MEVPARRRRALSTALALMLAVETVSAVAAAGLRVADRPTDGSGAAPTPVTAGVLAARDEVTTGGSTTADSSDPNGSSGTPPSVVAPAPTTPVMLRPAVDASLRARAGGSDPVSATARKATHSRPAAPGARKGRNHVWIPSLGMSRSVAWFPCDRSRAPDNLVYRWGCAGSNNVYLLGHAYGVFKPLHDAYVRGRLHKGLKVYYADARGKVHTYAVRWWRVVAPTTAASWAWAAQSTPSMTLQTCVGRNSAYRLMVRLVEVGR
jgi:Sortase domain